MERHRARGTTLLWRFWWSIPGPAPEIVALGQTITAQYDAQAIRKSGVFSDSGAAEGTRTPDPIITNDVLYQLSYCGFRGGS